MAAARGPRKRPPVGSLVLRAGSSVYVINTAALEYSASAGGESPGGAQGPQRGPEARDRHRQEGDLVAGAPDCRKCRRRRLDRGWEDPGKRHVRVWVRRAERRVRQ